MSDPAFGSVRVVKACAETADCGAFEPVLDPGRNSLQGRNDVRWERCVDCGEFFPISVFTGRYLSVVFFR